MQKYGREIVFFICLDCAIINNINNQRETLK